MNRKFLSILLIVAFATSLLLSVTFLVFKLYQKEQEDYIKNKQKLEQLDALIGKRVILDRDTFTIISYSILFNEVTLSNGRKVDIRYIEKPGIFIK
ncbi:MAG TPA: hypothetical protein PLP63_06390 [Saprospiraceae bacterium]|nr:hypothetical protein [Saprospiraceae bacterium]